jgi:hypothetical protein
VPSSGTFFSMATDYFSWTIPMAEADIPPDIAPDGGVLPDEIGHAMGHPHAVCTCSRNDWLHGALLLLFKELGGSTLEFLVKDPNLLPNVVETSWRQIPIADSPIQYQEVWVVTKLPHADLLSASRELDVWFARIVEEAARFEALLGGCIDPEELANWIEEAVDLRQDGVPKEDGDFATYLFCFLRALQALFQEAWELDLAVVHSRCTYLHRTVKAA